jgi:hypothetical protein
MRGRGGTGFPLERLVVAPQVLKRRGVEDHVWGWHRPARSWEDACLASLARSRGLL